MSGLAAGGSSPAGVAGAVAPAGAFGSRGGEPLGPGTGHTGVNLALCAGVPVVTVQGLDGGPGGDTSMLELVPDQRVQLEDPEEHFGQEVHIDLPWDQGELTVTFTSLASRRGSSTDFGP